MSQYASLSNKIKNIADLQVMKQQGEKIASLTAYDAGDSLGMVIQGHSSTLPVTMQDMLYHTQAVARGRKQAFIVSDLPFMRSATPVQAAENAALLIKLEGAKIKVIQFMVQQGIPVCAHLGLLPQSIYQMGKYAVQGKNSNDAEKILDQSLQIEQAGAQLLVLECVPAVLAKKITEALTIPVIGIGCGVSCDGQVLVVYDMLGISLGHSPRFTKDYLQQTDSIFAALEAYIAEVKRGEFPAQEHSF